MEIKMIMKLFKKEEDLESSINYKSDLAREVRKLQDGIVKETNKMITNYYDKLWENESKFPQEERIWGHDHNHRCAFEMMFPEKYAKEYCKEYLKAKDMKRDKCMCCCDEADDGGCKYMKFILCNDKDGNIIAVK